VNFRGVTINEVALAVIAVFVVLAYFHGWG
jgi:hypothetical protein